MPRTQMQKWGIEPVTSANGAGYSWQRRFDPRTGKPLRNEVLAPNRQIEERGESRYVIPGTVPKAVFVALGTVGEAKQRRGLDNASEAERAFVEIGRAFAQLWAHRRESPEEAEALEGKICAQIVNFANHYGSLRGDEFENCLSFEGWEKSALSYLDHRELARALRMNNYAEFERRVKVDDDRVVWYPAYGAPKNIAQRGDRYIGHSSPSEEMDVDWFANAHDGAPGDRRVLARQRAWMLLSKIVNEKMRGGIDFSINALRERQRTLNPHHLEHLLYFQLWRYATKNAVAPEVRICERDGCNGIVTGRSNKRFCSPACRLQHFRELRAN